MNKNEQTPINKTEKVIRVSAHTDANRLSGSIVATYNENNDYKITLRAIGAGALNQGIKAIILSNKFFIKKGLLAAVVPVFQDTLKRDIFPEVPADDETMITAIELRIRYERC